jgi:hypothetical protein
VRVIVQVFNRAWAFEMNLTRAVIRSPDDAEQCDEEEYDRAPMDPHSTVMCHLERRSDMEDAFGKAQFGFCLPEHALTDVQDPADEHAEVPDVSST